MTTSNNTPTDIKHHKKRRMLELVYADGKHHNLSCEFLRVYSPSAEVKGHGPGQEVLQTGKKNVAITAIRPVGHYAVQISFDDGHDSGIYSWNYLYELATQQGTLWQNYLEKLSEAKASRDPDVQVIRIGN